MGSTFQLPDRGAQVLLLADGEKAPVRDHVGAVQDWLQSRGVGISVEFDVRAFSQQYGGSSNVYPGIAPHLIVVLGGDGSVLAAARVFADTPVPIVGIKFGQLGFLAPVEASRWREALINVVEGKALIESRMMLEAQDAEGARHVALNDVVISRGRGHGLLGLCVEVGGEEVTEYRADGLIFATPSGSTAYSLAAGGPVLAPSMGGIVVTPIASHSLSNRPLVLAPDTEVRVRVDAAEGPVPLSVDGQVRSHLKPGQALLLSRHPHTYPLLAPCGASPWRRLRDRLGWRGSFLQDDVNP